MWTSSYCKLPNRQEIDLNLKEDIRALVSQGNESSCRFRHKTTEWWIHCFTISKLRSIENTRLAHEGRGPHFLPNFSWHQLEMKLGWPLFAAQRVHKVSLAWVVGRSLHSLWLLECVRVKTADRCRANG